MDCVFCGIVKGKIPATFIYQDEEIAVFTNIEPRAPVHLLLIPKKHIEGLEELDDQILLKIKRKVVDIVLKDKLSESGYRFSTNGGAAKAVSHLHFHLLGGVNAQREV